MENTDNNLMKVTQHDIKVMLEDRILNPKKYIDKPLLIWRGYFDDGIQEEIFFNLDTHVDDGKLNLEEEIARPAWEFLKLDNLKENRFFIPDKEVNLNRVFCFILKLSDQNIINPRPYDDYSGFINKDWLIKEQEILKAPIIVYLPFIEQPEAFKGFDQYVFTPDFVEWKEEHSKSHNSLTRHLIGFLESSINQEERDYRWYWYFQRQKAGDKSSDLKSHFEGKGCDFPSCWMEGLGKLRRHFILPMAQVPKNYIPPKPTKISEISAEEFKDFFKEGISEEVIEDYRKYLIKQDVEIQGNKR